MSRFSRLFATLLLTGVCHVTGQAQTIRSHSLNLEVTPLSAGSTVQNKSTSTGSRSSSNLQMTFAREKLQINVRNGGNFPDAAKVEWYFLAAPTSPTPGVAAAEQEYIFDQGSQDLSLGAGGTQVIAAESIDVSSSVKSSGKLGRNSRRGSSAPRSSGPDQKAGSVLRGWMVRVVADGKVVAARGSRQAYEDMAKNETLLADLADNTAPVDPKSKSTKQRTYKAGEKPVGGR